MAWVKLPEDEKLFVLDRDNEYWVVLVLTGDDVKGEDIYQVEARAELATDPKISFIGETGLFFRLNNPVVRVFFNKASIPEVLKPGHVLYLFVDVTLYDGRKFSVLQPPQRLRCVKAEI